MDDAKVLTPEEQNKLDVAEADKIRAEYAKMTKELTELVEYRKKVSGNITSVVTQKLKQLGIKVAYGAKDGVITNQDFKDLIGKHNTVYYIDGNNIYYVCLESIQ